jgi:hypothetical protein
MDPQPNQLSGTQAPVPNQLSTPAPAQGPVDEQPAGPPPAPRPRSRLRSFITSIGGRILIIGGIVLVAVLVRNYTSGNAGDLQVGDCFDPPTGVETVKDVQHHPCNEGHIAEVYFVGSYAAANDAPYPSTDAFDAFITDRCLPAFKAYTGSDALQQSLLDGGYFYPTSEGWTNGNDRGMLCYLYRADDQRATQSYRGANP